MARRENKIALNVGDDTFFKITMLADIKNTNPGRLCREILEAYLAAHEKEIAVAQQAANAYRNALKKLDPTISLFDDDTLNDAQKKDD